MDFSEKAKIINFSEKKKFFLPIFWHTRNFLLIDGYCRNLAEWYAIGDAIHETLVKFQMHKRDNTAFIFYIKLYLMRNGLVSYDLAIPHFIYESREFGEILT